MMNAARSNIFYLPQTITPDHAASVENVPPQNATDILRLTQGIVRGDESAFGEFYDLYTQRLHRLLIVITACEESLVRELHQEVMIKAARKFRVFDSDEALWRWLSRIARNTHIDHIRKSTRRAEQPLSPSLISATAIDQVNADNELFTGLTTALHGLDDEERALLDAVYVHGRVHADIAETTGQTSKAVESKLCRIRTKLRKGILSILKHEHRSE